MREELKNCEWNVHKLSEEDFDYTLDLTKRMIQARKESLSQYSKELRKDNPFAEDILDDVSYYTWVELHYFWHFCLWRLQAIFEGMITQTFLSHLKNRQLIGLKSKLDAMKKAGYSIEQDLYNEIIEWGKIRNVLSHCPPEQFNPVLLKEEDIKEYLGIIKEVVSVWRREEKTIHNT